MIHRIPAIDTLDENCGIIIPDARIRKRPNINHRSASENAVEGALIRYAVADYRKENYKTDFEIWNENSKLQSEHKNIEMSQPPLDLIPVGTKTPEVKTS